MSSLCDGADCFGLSTDLSGRDCLTNPVQCKDGVLTVPSQGSRFRRFAAFEWGDYEDGIPLDIPVGTTTATGPTAGGLPKLTVDFTNPFCVTASLVFHCEFAVRFAASTSDTYTANGDMEIAGTTARFYENNTPPFTTPTPLTTYQVELSRHDGSAITDNDLVIEQVEHHSYTLLGEVSAEETFTTKALSRIEFSGVTGGLRSVHSFNVALSILCTPKL